MGWSVSAGLEPQAEASGAIRGQQHLRGLDNHRGQLYLPIAQAARPSRGDRRHDLVLAYLDYDLGCDRTRDQKRSTTVGREGRGPQGNGPSALENPPMRHAHRSPGQHQPVDSLISCTMTKPGQTAIMLWLPRARPAGPMADRRGIANCWMSDVRLGRRRIGAAYPCADGRNGRCWTAGKSWGSSRYPSPPVLPDRGHRRPGRRQGRPRSTTGDRRRQRLRRVNLQFSTGRPDRWPRPAISEHHIYDFSRGSLSRRRPRRRPRHGLATPPRTLRPSSVMSHR